MTLVADLRNDAVATLDRHARTFRLASRFLPAATRDDAAVVYAFCRLVDDLADETGDRADLEAIRAELWGHRSPRPLVRAFLDVAPVGPALDLVAGALTDLDPVRIGDEAALIGYAYAVAGTVGLMMAPLLGAHAEGEPHAVHLGMAMQMTNIARDVGEDASRCRVYLPATWLADEGVGADEIVAGRADAAVARVVARLVARAEGYYDSGLAGLRHLPWRTRFAILVAARSYREIGAAVVRRGVSALRDRTVVTLPRKILATLVGLPRLLR